MSNQIGISADSTCDLTSELLQQYSVKTYPFYIRYRGKDYKDNVDIFPQDLYKGYFEDGSLPQTAASNINEYIDHFKQFTDNGMSVIHFSLGSGLSSAYDNARMAAEQLENVFVIDSCNLSCGIGLLVLAAAKMVDAGKSVEEIVDAINKMIPNIHTSFVLDTLDFMAAGGRCPAVAAKAAGMLKCRPSLTVDCADGSLHMSKMYRGKTEKVLEKYIADQLSDLENVDTTELFITNSGNVDDKIIQLVIDEVEKYTKFERVHKTLASCTISSHCGPGCLGILFATKS